MLFGIDEDLHAVVIEDVVVRARLGVELELIAQARATAAEHAETQPAALEIGTPIFVEGLADFLDRFRRYGDGGPVLPGLALLIQRQPFTPPSVRRRPCLLCFVR